MDRRTCELFEKGREQGVRPANLDQPRVLQAFISAPVIDAPLSEYERHDAYATQPGWRNHSDLAWLEIPCEKSV